MNASRPVRGRLAPSPTGFLHLGNAWAFLLAWLACRSKGGSLVLRMEDIDPDRSRAEYADAIIRDLRWLGLDWDEGPDVGGPAGPYTQSARMELYADALNRLDRAGHTYPCYCTRKELRTLAGAPHVGDAGAAYPGTCRNLPPERRAELEASPGMSERSFLSSDSPIFSMRRSAMAGAYDIRLVDPEESTMANWPTSNSTSARAAASCAA